MKQVRSHKKLVVRQFNASACPGQMYARDRTTIKAKKKEHKIVSNLLDNDENGKKVLDAGCGVGGYFETLLGRGYSVIGVDIAQNPLKVCHSKYPEVALVLADIERIPFRADSFDLILCIDTLQYLDSESRTRAVESLVDLLKPGKIIILDVKNKWCPAYWLKRGGLKKLYSIRDIIPILTKTGCEEIKVREAFPLSLISPILVITAKKRQG